MFERIFGMFGGGEKEPTEQIREAVENELSTGVNQMTMTIAFDAARKLNKEGQLGLTNNHILNIVRESAMGLSTPMEDVLQGGSDQTGLLINQGIEILRESLTPEERRN